MIIKESVIRNAVRECLSNVKKGLYPITEHGIMRMLSHGKDGYFCISGNLSVINGPDVPKECSLENNYMRFLNRTEQEDTAELRSKWLSMRNKWADKKLKEIIEKSGYTYSKTYGGYKEDGSSPEDYEPSYIVYNRYRDGSVGNPKRMRCFALKLARDFKQQDVYVKMPDRNEEYLNQSGNVSAYGDGEPKINRSEEQYFTTSKRKNNDPHRFTSNMTWVESRYYSPIGSITERRKREYFGEVILG